MSGTDPEETRGERVAFWVYSGIAWLASRLPESLGRRAFDLAGRVAFALGSRRRAVVAANMGHVLGRAPEDALVQATTKEAYRSYARYWFETFRLPVWGVEEVTSRTRATGEAFIDTTMADGKGCLIVLCHLGNWDAGGAWLVGKGVPAVAVAEDLRPRRLMEMFRAHRESLGIRIEVLGDGIVQRVATHLRAGSAVGLVADRDLSGKGIEVEMFGAPRKLPAGPALLHLMTGAPILPIAVYITDDGWHVVVDPPVTYEATGDRRADVEAITRLLAAHMERQISADPAQWHMFQQGWP